jgi:hypothetical protein
MVSKKGPALASASAGAPFLLAFRWQGNYPVFVTVGASTYLALMQLSVCCQLTTVQSLSDGELGLSDLAIADRLQAPW